MVFKIKNIVKIICISTVIMTTSAQSFSAQFTYTVKSGDSLWSIANNYGTTISQIIQDNSLVDANNIYSGEKLAINTPSYYTVKSGDSLYTISKRFNLTVNDLINFNHLTNTYLYVGQSLRIVPEGIPNPIIYTSQTKKVVSTTGQYVSIGSTYNNSNFYYTTDGSVPSKYNGTCFTGGFYVGKNYIGPLSLKVIAYDMSSGYEGTPSDVVDSKFDFIPNPPSFSIPSLNSDGTQKIYTSTQSMSLSSPDNGEIYYTTDGLSPIIGNQNTNKYSSPIVLDKNTTVSAVVYKKGEVSNSSVNNYIINIPPKSISAPAANIGNKAEIAQNTILYFSTNDSNATIYYTIDGSNPDSTKLKYNPSTGIKLDHSYVIKAVAINGTQQSSISTNFYAVDEVSGFTMKSQTSTYDIFYGIPYTLDYIFTRYGTLPSEVLANNTWISQSVGLNDNLYTLYGTRWVTLPIRRYKINVGDSLHSIAELGGYSVDDLIKINSMKSDTLYVGQYIFIPKLNYTTNSWSYDNLTKSKISNAPSIMLPPTWITSDPRYNQSHGSNQYDEDIYWLKQIIEAESGGEPLAGQQAVGIVIMNRLAIERLQYRNNNISVKDILFDYSRNNDTDLYPSNQFVPVINNRIYSDTIGSTIASAADYAYNKNLSVIYNNITYNLSQALFFINPQQVSNSWFNNYCTLIAVIKNHNFYSENNTTVLH